MNLLIVVDESYRAFFVYPLFVDHFLTVSVVVFFAFDHATTIQTKTMPPNTTKKIKKCRKLSDFYARVGTEMDQLTLMVTL